MKIVIDIADKCRKKLDDPDAEWDFLDIDYIFDCIRKGAPLPETVTSDERKAEQEKAGGKTSKNIKKKILPKYFKDVESGIKTFELRKDEDNIQPGDVLDLLEWTGNEYTGRNQRCEVTYVLRNCPEYGLMDGYCIIGIEAIGEVWYPARQFRIGGAHGTDK